jgi:transcriptional regulator with XRE-family HTH domain
MLDEGKLYVELGKRVQQLRRMQSPLMSQAQLAAILGLTRTSVTNLERGTQKITLGTLYRLCETFGKPVAEILPALVDVSAGAEQSVTVAGQAYALPTKTANSVRRFLPAGEEKTIKGRR